MKRKNSLSSAVLIITLSLLLSNWAFAQDSSRKISEDPSAMAMTADALFVRPVMFTVTVVGSVLWVVSLPFSAAGGNVKQAGNTLVVKPAVNTFVRCLGCTQAGYKHDVPQPE